MTDVPIGAVAAFDAVVEERLPGCAAVKLGISQPAVTQRIHSLERTLHKPVFVRTPRGAELPPAGRVLLEQTRASWELWQRATADLRDASPSADAVRLAYPLTTDQKGPDP